MNIKKIITELSIFSTWNKSNTLKVLIKEFEGFLIDDWFILFEDQFNELKKVIDIKFVNDRFEFYNHIKRANIVFSNNIDDIFLVKDLIFFQYVLSGIDYEEKYIDFRDKLVTSKGLASSLVAEFVISCIFLLTKRWEKILEINYNRDWDQKKILNGLTSIEGKKICIFGYGSIGKEIVNKLNNFNPQIYIIDKNITPSLANIGNLNYINSLEEIKEGLDFFIVAVPLTKNTRGIINLDVFNKLSKNCHLISISRFEIIDENSLLVALKNELIAGAILDILPEEPLSKNSLYWNLNNLIITPHIAGNINLIKKKIMQRFVSNIKNVLEHKNLEGLYFQ